MIYSLIAANGLCVGTLEVPDLATALLNCGADQTIFEGRVDRLTEYVLEGQILPLPPKPGPWAVFDLASGIWTDPRTAADLEQDALQRIADMRAERDRRLAASDWTQMPDNPLSVTMREAWQTYRQSLRDLPETATDLAETIWPTPPLKG